MPYIEKEWYQKQSEEGIQLTTKQYSQPNLKCGDLREGWGDTEGTMITLFMACENNALALSVCSIMLIMLVWDCSNISTCCFNDFE